MNVFVVVTLLLAWNPFKMEMPEVRRGNEAMRQGRYDKAEEQYRAALARRPGEPRIVYDLGLALLAQGKYDEAAKTLDEAASVKDDELRYQALFHEGIAKFHNGDKDLESYRPQRVAIQTSFNEFESATDEKAKTQAAQKTLQLISQARPVLKRAREKFEQASDTFASALEVRAEEEGVNNRELAMDRIEKVDDELDWLDELEEKLRKYMKDKKNKKQQQNQKKNNQNQQQKKNKKQNQQNKQQKQQQKQQQNQNQQQQKQQSQQNQNQQKNSQGQDKKKDQQKGSQNQRQGQNKKDQQNRQNSQGNQKDRSRGGAAGKGKAKKKMDPALRAVFRALDELKARQRRLMRERYLKMRRYRRKILKDW